MAYTLGIKLLGLGAMTLVLMAFGLVLEIIGRIFPQIKK